MQREGIGLPRQANRLAICRPETPEQDYYGIALLGTVGVGGLQHGRLSTLHYGMEEIAIFRRSPYLDERGSCF